MEKTPNTELIIFLSKFFSTESNTYEFLENEMNRCQIVAQNGYCISSSVTNVFDWYQWEKIASPDCGNRKSCAFSPLAEKYFRKPESLDFFLP